VECSVAYSLRVVVISAPAVRHQVSLSDWFSRPVTVFPIIMAGSVWGMPYVETDEGLPFSKERPTSHTMTFGAVKKDEG
jgi:hypothetical protein